MPGGYGTLDEFTEAINLIQTQRISKFPVVLFGNEYWKGMIDWFKATLFKSGNISRKDLDIFTIVDKPKDVIAAIKKFYKEK
jgi:uncharacterized protein (TIGR00730 family)